MKSKNTKILFWLITVLAWLLLFTPLIISSQTLFPFQVGKGIAYRVLIEIMLFLYIWLILIEPKFRPKKTGFLLAVLVFTGVLILSTLTSAFPYRSFWGDIERMEGVFGILHGVALFLILGSVFQRKEDWLRFFRVSLLASFIVFGYGLLQKIGASGVFESGSPHPGSTLGNAAFVATYALFHIFFGLLLVVWEKNLWWKVYGGVIGFLNLILLYWTVIRGGQVGLFAAVFVLGVLIVIWGSGRWRKIAIAVVVISLIIPSLIFILRDSPLMDLAPGAIQRLADISLEEDPTLNTRLISVGISWEAVKERPILGYGMENFRVGYNKHFNPEHLTFEQAWFDRAHNKIAETAVTLGMVGLISYLAIFALGFWGLLGILRTNGQRKDDQMVKGSNNQKNYSAIKPSNNFKLVVSITIAIGVAYFVQNIFLFDMPMSYLVFFSSLAFAQFLIASTKEIDSTKNQWIVGSVAKGVILTIAAIFILFLVIWTNWRPYQSSHWGRQGLGAQTPQEALAAYGKAIELNGYPKSEVLRVMTDTMLANSRVREDKWKEVFELLVFEMEKYLEEEPADPRFFIRLGKVYNERSLIENKYLEDAERVLSKAIDLVPKRPDAYYEYGVTFIQLGKMEEALKIFEEAVAINEKNARAHWTYGLALSLANRRQDGIRELEKAIELGYGWFNGPDINNLAQVYTIAQEFDKLVAMYEEATEFYPDNAEYFASLATAYAQVGQFDNAIQAAQTAAELDPRFAGEVEGFIQSLRQIEAE
jgi:O-antigen ligase/tetratricopeptide (TPR) repeat protein